MNHDIYMSIFLFQTAKNILSFCLNIFTNHLQYYLQYPDTFKGFLLLQYDAFKEIIEIYQIYQHSYLPLKIFKDYYF
jgi:hypothetical protein